MAQRLNNKNNSYLTHFLMFAFPPKKFKSTPSLLSSLLEVVSLDLGKVCREGFWIGDTQYHVAIVGMAGDMEHHSKTGILNRSYQNVGHKNFLACCHECHAGLIAYPFEDVSSDPKWKETLYSSVPWAVTPPFKHIPFANWDTGDAARFFKRDPFHIFRLGIARHFIGSTVVMYCLQGVFDSPGDSSISIEARLRRAWGCFSLWCDTHHVSTAGIRSFTKEKLHMQATGAFPWVGCKGSDTILLLKWLRFKSGLYAAQNCSFKDVFQLVYKTADSGLAFQAIHAHGIWLRSGCRVQIMQRAKRFVQNYARLAHRAFQRRQQLYCMVPKFHAMDHFPVQLALQQFEEYACNPAVYDTSMSEDFIGHVSRQSRRVSYVHIIENTLLAYKVRARFIIKNYKKQRD